MTINKPRLVAAVSGRLQSKPVRRQQRLQWTSDAETFRLSVQFARAHGIQLGAARGEITTLCSGNRSLADICVP